MFGYILMLVLKFRISLLGLFYHLPKEAGQDAGFWRYFSLSKLSAKEVVVQTSRQGVSVAKDLSTEGPFSSGCYQSKDFALCLWFRHTYYSLFQPVSNYLCVLCLTQGEKGYMQE